MSTSDSHYGADSVLNGKRKVETVIETSVALRLIQSKTWHHDFEVVPGVRTHGAYNPIGLWNELQLPDDLRGMSLADVGASNGFFSFEARRRGARVVAFDYRHKNNSGFALAQYLNGFSDIDHHQVNVLEMDVETYGQFDVVLALGLLYHTSDPYLALANCAALSRKRLLIESYCIDSSLPAQLREEPLMRFIRDAERFPSPAQANPDRSNFWGFTSVCLRHMVEDVGFSVQRVDVRGDRVFIDAARAVADRQATRLWLAHDLFPEVPARPDRDEPASWTIY
jgi:tRNA (mo5U34)-methyltransferase